MRVARDRVVSLQYQLTDADGTLLEKSSEPVSYLHGGYDGIFPLVEEALQDKEVGDRCVVEMQPDDAFGEYDHDLVRVEPRGLFPDNVAVGMQFEGGAEGADDDDYMLYTVVEVNSGEVVVDGNHPLAGKALSFDCTVADVRPATPEEIAHGHVHGADGHHHH